MYHSSHFIKIIISFLFINFFGLRLELQNYSEFFKVKST